MRASLLVLVAVWLLPACGGAMPAAGGDGVVLAGPQVQVAERRCLLLSTNDSEAHFDGAKSSDGSGYLGTISRVAAWKQRMAAERAGAVLLVEGGDVLQGRFMARADGDRGQAMRSAWQIYEQAGYDFGALGNHEFDAGPKLLRFALQGLQRYRLLAANVVAQGTSLEPSESGRPAGLFGASALADCGGIRVGLFGLLTPTSRTISQMGDVQMAADPLRQPARQAVAELRSQGAQLVILLSHLGLEEDVALATDVTGIDVIVGGHSHTRMPRAQRVGETLITQTGSRFADLGELEVVLDADGHGLDPVRSRWSLRAIDTALPVDAQVQAKVDQLRATLVPERAIGYRKQAWDLTDPRGAYSLAATAALVKAGQQAVQSWQTELRAPPVTAGLLNVGGFRSHTLYLAGPVTNLDIAAIHPFANRAVLIEVSGQQLIDTLEHGCAPGSDGHGQGLVFFGLSARCDRTKPVARYRMVDGRPVELVERGQRLVEGRIGGQPIDLKARYRIATIDYLAKGGSGYFSLTQGDRRCFDGAVFSGDGKNCPSPMMADLIEGAVKAGTFEL